MYRMPTISVNLAKTELATFKAAAKSLGITVSAWVRRGVRIVAGVENVPLTTKETGNREVFIHWSLDTMGKKMAEDAAEKDGISLNAWIRLRLIVLAKWEAEHGAAEAHTVTKAREKSNDDDRKVMIGARVERILHERIRLAAKAKGMTMAEWLADVGKCACEAQNAPMPDATGLEKFDDEPWAKAMATKPDELAEARCKNDEIIAELGRKMVEKRDAAQPKPPGPEPYYGPLPLPTSIRFRPTNAPPAQYDEDGDLISDEWSVDPLTVEEREQGERDAREFQRQIAAGEFVPKVPQVPKATIPNFWPEMGLD